MKKAYQNQQKTQETQPKQKFDALRVSPPAFRAQWVMVSEQCTGSWERRSNASPKTPQVGPSWGPNGGRIGRPRGLHVGKNCDMKSRRPKKSKPPKIVTLFGDLWAPSWGAKIVHFEENRLQEASWKRFEAILKRDRQKSPYRSLSGAIFARFAVVCRSWRCGPRSIIYSTSWLSVLRR